MLDLREFVKFHILPYWKTIIVISVPLLLSPVPIIGAGTEARTGYVIAIMAIFWMTEAIPLAATALLPVVLFPLFGIMDTGKVCTAYMKETNMMFIGGLMVALTIEHCNLHRRIALRVLMVVGAGARWLMLGFMLTTAFLSMWISNTATTAMMVPIVEAVVEVLFMDDEDPIRMVPIGSSSPPSAESNSSIVSVDDERNPPYVAPANSVESISDVGKSRQQLTSPPNQRDDEFRCMKKCMMLSVAYSANLGGTGTIIGSGTNLVMKGILKDNGNDESKRNLRVCMLMSTAYASNIGGTGSLIGSSPQLALKGILHELYGSAPGLNFASWMAFNIPGMLINILLAWIWLQFLFIGFKKASDDGGKEAKVKYVIRQKYEELGPMTFHEAATLTLFITCVLLWFFRDPQFIPGWAELLHTVEVDDATAVMTIVMLLFTIPAKPRFWCFRSETETGPERPSPALLNWKYVQENLPWGIVLLLGGGFALSDASKASGLSKWLGQQLTGLQVLPPFAIMLVVCIMTATITEVASNTATANILLPILSEMAVSIEINPLFLMLPATVTCSYAFMLPVATPPNAIVFSAGNMNPVDMVKAGFLMNIICVIIICVLTTTLGTWMFNFGEFPSWAIVNATTVSSQAATELIAINNCSLVL